ncbi:MAG: multidrug efflux system membrane fusion protein [Paracoccaceae bacterium]|jgi:multidrug efflux system membrane fusion protein
MRVLSIITACLVMLALYGFIFERERVAEFVAGLGPQQESPAAPVPAPVAINAALPDDTAARAVSVVAKRFTAQMVQDGVLVRGRTQANREVAVRAETGGLITSEPLRKGIEVQQGQILCEIAPGTRLDALAEAKAYLSEARARLPESDARVDEARARLIEAEINDRVASQLSQDGFATETRVAATVAAVSSAKAALQSAVTGVEAAKAGIESASARVTAVQTDIARLQIMAPFSGLLETDTAELGTLLQAGDHCATVIQLTPIKLVGDIPEMSVDKVRVGAISAARLVTGRQVTGPVTFLSRSADLTTRTFRVEVSVPNTDLTIRDGQTVEFVISAAAVKAHLVPASALTRDDTGTIGVRLVDADTTATFAPVTILRDSLEGYLVRGLPDEVAVITTGQEYVGEGSPLKVTFEEAAR